LIAGGVIPKQPSVLVVGGRLLLKCLVALASDLRDLCFLAGSG
jgi:hypothetical protein